MEKEERLKKIVRVQKLVDNRAQKDAAIAGFFTILTAAFYSHTGDIDASVIQDTLLKALSTISGTGAVGMMYASVDAVLKSLKLDLEKRKLEEEMGYNQREIKQHI